MAIHFDPVNEETSCSRSPRHDGLPRRHWGCLLAMTIFCSILSLLLSSSRGCSPWRSTSSANLTVLMGCVDCIQWIAASVTSLPSRNDKEGELEYFGVSLIRLQVKVDCHVGTVGASSQ